MPSMTNGSSDLWAIPHATCEQFNTLDNAKCNVSIIIHPMHESPSNEPVLMDPALREAIVQQLKTALDLKRNSLPGEVVTEIHNALMYAEVPEEDAEADGNYRTAAQKIVELGILSKEDLAEVIRGCKAQFE